MTFAAKGLEGIVVTTSAISTIDGQAGILSYRGYDIHDLAPNCSFEEVVYLLWFGELPTADELASFRERIPKYAELNDATIKFLASVPKGTNPMDVLRTAVSAIPLFYPTIQSAIPSPDPTANLDAALNLVAKVSLITALYHRIRSGRDPVVYDKSAGIAENFLHIIRGKKPTSLDVKVFDMGLVLHADHEFNASTFAGRVTASTLSDIYSAITTAIGTLKGPLHGGANEQVLAQLKEIGSLEKVESYIEKAFAAKKRIMGFGHRVYKTEDPRATHLRRLAEQLAKQAGDMRLFEIQRRIEQLVKEKKGLYPNVDFYSAAVYHYLGIPTDLFTPIFACSRISGWTAHVMEQYSDNRLIRPVAEYTGPMPRSFVPIEERG
ncbi:MAG: citrate synthase [Deltaproteobacteria bacterium]|nr:citrate synthase [Deltaproteobacteria bacterium]